MASGRRRLGGHAAAMVAIRKGLPALVVLVLLAAGCSDGDDVTDAPSPTATTVSEPAPSADPTETPSSTETPTPVPDPGFAVVDLGLGGVERPPIVLAVDEAGEFIAVAPSEGGLWAVRCGDQDCSDPRTEVVLPDFEGMNVQVAIRGDGAIVAAFEEGDTGARRMVICDRANGEVAPPP